MNTFKYKFKRYDVIHNHKKYVVMVPYKVANCMWIVDWADWWYGTFLRCSMRGYKILNTCFSLLSFNPHVIIYLPIKDTLIPYYMSEDPNDGSLDVVFTTEQSRVKGSTWVQIRKKMKKMKPKTYVFKYDIDRMNYYFKDKVKLVDEISFDKVCNNAHADCWLYADTAFFSYPTACYQTNCLQLDEYYEELKNYNFRNCYNEKDDTWCCNTMTNFSYGARRKYTYTDESPDLTLNIEIYSYKIANRYRKQKDYLVSKENRMEPPFRNERYMKIGLK